MSDFPTDEATLLMLAEACRINPDSGQTHLHAFLEMGARIKSSTDITGEVFGEMHEGAPVYEVEYEEGYEPFSEHHVIRTLVAELLEARRRISELESGS